MMMMTMTLALLLLLLLLLPQQAPPLKQTAAKASKTWHRDVQPTLERRSWCATLVKRPKSQDQAFWPSVHLCNPEMHWNV
jgi:hypothetical protein